MKSFTVAKRFDGTWTVKVTGETKTASLHKTMDEAIEVAKRALRAGGGELRVKVNYETTIEVIEKAS